MADKSPFLKNSSSHRIKTFQIFEEEIVKWIEQVLSVKIDKGLDTLRDGIYLCNLILKIKPGILKEDFKNVIRSQSDKEFNLKLFIQGCEAYGVDYICSFEDLMDTSNPAAMISTIQNLAALAEQKGFKPVLKKNQEGESESEGSVPNSPTRRSLSRRSITVTRQEREERLRQLTVEEILVTERDYVRDLDLIIEIFLKPLRAKKVLDSDSINILFSNIEMIISIHKQFLKQLEEKLEESSAQYWIVGDVFLKTVDFLKIYTSYITNQEQANALLKKLQTQQTFAAWLETTQSNPSLNRLTLNDYLVKPVQRICKYPLFIRELLKRTRETSTDYENLKQALTKIEAVVVYVNEDKRTKERSARSTEVMRGVIGFEDIVPVRQLLKEGELTIISTNITKKPIEHKKGSDSKKSDKKSAKKLYCFLFADLFLVCKAKSGGGPLLGNKRGSLHFRGQLYLHGCYFFDVPDQKDYKHLFAIRKGNETKVTIQAKNLDEKTAWMNEFLKALELSAARIRLSGSNSATDLQRSSGTFPPVPKPKPKDYLEQLEEERKVIKQLEEWKENYLSTMDSLKKQIGDLQEDVSTKKKEILQLKEQIEEKKQVFVQAHMTLMELKEEGSDLESNSLSVPNYSDGRVRSSSGNNQPAPLRSWNRKIVSDYQDIEGQLSSEKKATKMLEEWKAIHLIHVDQLKSKIRAEVDQKIDIQEQCIILEKEIMARKAQQ